MPEKIHADIVATVLEIMVETGQQIPAGGTVMMLESMKMEIPVLTEAAGRVALLPVPVGAVVGEGDLLAELE